MEAAAPAILQLKAAVYGDVEGPRPRASKAAAPRAKKRAADVAVDKVWETVFWVHSMWTWLQGRLEELRALGQKALLSKKVAELEALCEELELPKSGNKQQKVQRIQQYLDEQGP